MQTARFCARLAGALALTALLAQPVAMQGAPALAGAAVPGVSATTITVGGIFAQTGPARLICGIIEQGAVQAIAEINARGGIYGRKLRFVVEDDGFDPARSLGAMRKLVEKDGVFAIVGTCGSDTTLATLAYTEAHHIPVINPVAGDIAGLGALRWTWVTEGQYQDDLVAMAKYAIRIRGARRIGLVYREDAAARSYREILGAAVAKLGGRLVDAEPIVTGAQTSFAATITRLRQAGPDLVMVGIYLQDGALFFRDAQRLRYRPPGNFMLTYDLADPAFTALAGPWAIGATVSDFIDLSLHAPYMRHYLAAARLRPEQFSPYKWVDYNGYQIFGAMLRAVGPNLTREAFRRAADARFLHHRAPFGPLFSFTPTHRFGITQFAMFRVGRAGFSPVSGYISANL